MLGRNVEVVNSRRRSSRPARTPRPRTSADARGRSQERPPPRQAAKSVAPPPPEEVKESAPALAAKKRSAARTVGTRTATLAPAHRLCQCRIPSAGSLKAPALPGRTNTVMLASRRLASARCPPEAECPALRPSKPPPPSRPPRRAGSTRRPNRACRLLSMPPPRT